MPTRTATTLAILAMLAPPGVARAADTQVQLNAGQDYLLVAAGDEETNADGSVTMTDPGGTVVASASAAADTVDGTEFRARYSAVYRMHVASGFGRVAPDCRGGTATRCHVAIHHTKNGAFNAGYDSDWYKVRLLRSYTYHVTYTPGPPHGVLIMHDARGRTLARADGGTLAPLTLAFRPPASGDYFIEAINLDDNGDLFAGPYTIGLR